MLGYDFRNPFAAKPLILQASISPISPPELRVRGCDALLVAASRLVGKAGPTRVAAPSWRLRRSVNQHRPPRSRINQHFLWLVPARLAGAYGDLPTGPPSVRKGPADSEVLMLSPATPQIRVSVGKKNTIGDNFSPFGALLLALRAK